MNKPTSTDYAGIIYFFYGFIMSCCCCCLCCCNCCFTKDILIPSVKKVYHLLQKLSRFLIKTSFGPKESILDRFPEYKEDEEGMYGNSKIYLRNRELNYREISILAILITTFGLLAAITAWDSYFLDITYVCSVQPGVYCFPIALDPDAEDDFNLTDVQKHRITDCSYWISENVSSRVSFTCFQWAFDTKAVISDVGGLLTMFVITMKIASSGSLIFFNWAIKKYSPEKSDGKENYTPTIGRYRRRRILSIFVVAFAEINLGLFLVLMTYFAVTTNNRLIDFFYERGNQFLLVVGIFSSLLLLPLEEYALNKTSAPVDEENVPPTESVDEHAPLLHNQTSRALIG